MNSLTSNTTKLGYIGLGAMGRRIAVRLLAAGYEVSVFARNPSKRAALEAKGATGCDSVAELARSVHVVLSCLSDDEAVRDVYFGPGGVLASAKSGTIVIEMSTILPATSRELASKASRAGVQVLDVAISGSTPAAEQGTVTLLAGGNPDVFEASVPIFKAIAAKYFHLGPSGAGTTMKMVVNAILGIGMQAIAEAAAMGEKAGLSREILLQVLSQTAVIAPAHVGKLSKAARGDYSPQFPLALMNKDFRLILQLAGEVKAVMPATSAAFQVNSETLDMHGDLDFSAVMDYMEHASAKQASSQFTTG
ncbi:MAG TPA: NAD(P)-dependent oxidoreductase [Candidatus Acidoferrales bacterium]|jgi:3-hydroxyisobutyrate dehydrogenase-like beta-hydroxyacid dehydrogenase|nr:NAD(P)-dependent oxidoreductase [Candidatus Acidoferrales bacterium]